MPSPTPKPVFTVVREFIDNSCSSRVQKKSANLELFQQGKRQLAFAECTSQTVSDAICSFKELGDDGRRPGSVRKRKDGAWTEALQVVKSSASH
ncbi:hypothetical protein TNCV_3807791 [Trichonephila clavipes]|nr:hypothetical protein TNCV_3807791 [Trichonephila clavipes]